MLLAMFFVNHKNIRIENKNENENLQPKYSKVIIRGINRLNALTRIANKKEL